MQFLSIETNCTGSESFDYIFNLTPPSYSRRSFGASCFEAQASEQLVGRPHRNASKGIKLDRKTEVDLEDNNRGYLRFRARINHSKSSLVKKVGPGTRSGVLAPDFSIILLTRQPKLFLAFLRNPC